MSLLLHVGTTATKALANDTTAKRHAVLEPQRARTSAPCASPQSRAPHHPKPAAASYPFITAIIYPTNAAALQPCLAGLS